MMRHIRQPVYFIKQIAIGVFIILLILVVFYPQFLTLIPPRWRPLG